MVFAGLVDGSLCVWDLHESSDLHPEASHSTEGGSSGSGRTPTFITAATDDNHPVPVLDVVTLGGGGKNAGRKDAASFQVTS